MPEGTTASAIGLSAVFAGAGPSSATKFSVKMKRVQAWRKASGVFCWPMPKTSIPCSRMRAASRVKSLSEETRQNPSKRPECSRSIASITSVMSVEFLPVV